MFEKKKLWFIVSIKDLNFLFHFEWIFLIVFIWNWNENVIRCVSNEFSVFFILFEILVLQVNLQFRNEIKWDEKWREKSIKYKEDHPIMHVLLWDEMRWEEISKIFLISHFWNIRRNKLCIFHFYYLKKTLIEIKYDGCNEEVHWLCLDLNGYKVLRNVFISNERLFFLEILNVS